MGGKILSGLDRPETFMVIIGGKKILFVTFLHRLDLFMVNKTAQKNIRFKDDAYTYTKQSN